MLGNKGAGSWVENSELRGFAPIGMVEYLECRFISIICRNSETFN